MSTATTTLTTTRTTSWRMVPEVKPARGLTLAIGPRRFHVDLRWWSVRGNPTVRLEDVETGRRHRIEDLQDGTATCTCRSGRPKVECGHVRTLRRLALIQNATLNEGEDD